MKRLALLGLVSLFSFGCHMSASSSSPSGGGDMVGTNPDRPVGSVSASVNSPDGGGGVVGTQNSTTQRSSQP